MATAALCNPVWGYNTCLFNTMSLSCEIFELSKLITLAVNKFIVLQTSLVYHLSISLTRLSTVLSYLFSINVDRKIRNNYITSPHLHLSYQYLSCMVPYARTGAFQLHQYHLLLPLRIKLQTISAQPTILSHNFCPN